MYFAYGWPRVAFTGLPPNDSYIFLKSTEKYLLAVSRTCVQLWTGGLYRIKLSECERTEEDVKQEGLHIAAMWSSAKATLAILVRACHVSLEIMQQKPSLYWLIRCGGLLVVAKASHIRTLL